MLVLADGDGLEVFEVFLGGRLVLAIGVDEVVIGRVSVEA